MSRFIPGIIEVVGLAAVVIGVGFYAGWWLSLAVWGGVILMLVRTVNDD